MCRLSLPLPLKGKGKEGNLPPQCNIHHKNSPPSIRTDPTTFLLALSQIIQFQLFADAHPFFYGCEGIRRKKEALHMPPLSIPFMIVFARTGVSSRMSRDENLSMKDGDKVRIYDRSVVEDMGTLSRKVFNPFFPFSLQDLVKNFLKFYPTFLPTRRGRSRKT